MDGSIIPPLFGGNFRDIAGHSALGAAEGTVAGSTGGLAAGGTLWALRGSSGRSLMQTLRHHGGTWAVGGLVAGALLGSNLTPDPSVSRGQRAVNTGFVMSAIGAAAVAVSATGRGGSMSRLRGGAAGLVGGGASGALAGALGMPQHFVLVRERQH